MKFFTTIVLVCLSISLLAQKKLTHDQYSADLNKLSNSFFGFLGPHLKALYTLPQDKFISKIDSLKAPFFHLIERYKANLGTSFAQNELIDDDFSFDQFVLNYPFFHQEYTRSTVIPSKEALKRLKKHKVQFNNPKYLKLASYNQYVDAVIHFDWLNEVKKGMFAGSDNKKLDGVFEMLPLYFKNKVCLEYWEYSYLKYQIENLGIKDIEKQYQRFISDCSDISYRKEIRKLYNADLQGRKGHIIETYKKVGSFSLDIHLFLPDSNKFKSVKKPMIVFFHGGSWTEGKPDWFFGSCKYYASIGWAAAAVEYRIGDRHGTLPFESVMDAKSAIRWLRENAGKYKFDQNKIVASGNSAGGHLVLCTVLIDGYNERTDNLAISPVADILMVNSAVYDLSIGNDWINMNLANPDSAIAISPFHHIKKITQPILMIHGSADNNVPYSTAEKFAKAMKELSNPVEFKTMQGSGHFLWYDPRFSAKTDSLRGAFLEANGIK